MRSLCETFAICIGSLLLVSFQTGFTSDLQTRSSSLAQHIEQEGNYSDLSFSELQSICKIVHVLQSKPKVKRVTIYRSQEVSGTFYRLASSDEVLYCPPKTDKFMLGKGSIKKVYKSLFFTRTQGEVVAAGIGNNSMDCEIKALRSIPFPPHLGLYRCSFTLSNGQRILAIRYYNMSSLRFMRSKGLPLSRRERLFVAKYIIETLMIMHRMKVAHRDLHDGNIVVNRAKDGTISAGLIDFGRAISLSHFVSTKPQGSPYRNPPEILLHSFSSIDQKQADIFALGCCFYRLFFGKMYSGSYMYTPKRAKHMKENERKALYENVKRKYAAEFAKLQETLHQTTGSEAPLSAMEILKKNIFLMIDPEPKKRISLSQMKKMIDAAMRTE